MVVSLNSKEGLGIAVLLAGASLNRSHSLTPSLTDDTSVNAQANLNDDSDYHSGELDPFWKLRIKTCLDMLID